MDETTKSGEPTITGRGFKHFGPVPSEYGGFIRTYESSAASGPHLWVLIECPDGMSLRDGATKDAAAHLTLENAEVLRDQLTYLIDNHYQVK